MPNPLPRLHGARLDLRPAHEQDAAALAAILAEPDVAQWWGRYDEARVREELRTLRSFAIVERETGVLAGWLHVDEESEPDYARVAFDIALASALHGRGYGREALRLAIDHFIARGHHRFTIDPAVANERAIRCYAAVGFRSVGVLRAYERGPDGRWRDGLLMDLLAGDLDEPAARP